MMKIRCCIVLLHLVMLNEVSLQNPVVGFIGGSAVLPCFSKEGQRKHQEITVHWRYNDSLNVYDIINGQGSVEEQHSAYKGRAETFSDDFEKGNFSLKLSNLQHNDTGNMSATNQTFKVWRYLSKRKKKASKYKKRTSKQKKKGTKEHNPYQRRS
ncbi:CD276 antigen homolog [Sinocyclocheilus anshuiensis]|uniref:CD276 antigen homolog n=1 Tax=Sinocyclocheilus anshuiensis TaxID=1608454 RepID=UPI0007B85805|nr:PREDICTED: CD276 antigen homolog [Sinocyclocheilus anshuiensis]